MISPRFLPVFLWTPNVCVFSQHVEAVFVLSFCPSILLQRCDGALSSGSFTLFVGGGGGVRGGGGGWGGGLCVGGGVWGVCGVGGGWGALHRYRFLPSFFQFGDLGFVLILSPLGPPTGWVFNPPRAHPKCPFFPHRPREPISHSASTLADCFRTLVNSPSCSSSAF